MTRASRGERADTLVPGPWYLVLGPFLVHSPWSMVLERPHTVDASKRRADTVALELRTKDQGGRSTKQGPRTKDKGPVAIRQAHRQLLISSVPLCLRVS